MKQLSYLETLQITGGHQLTADAVFSSMEHYSFLFALFGGAASGIYGLCTNATVTTLSNLTLTMTGSFTTVFWMGMGISWAVGASVGLGVAIYNAEFVDIN
jgi:hypothetical protein